MGIVGRRRGPEGSLSGTGRFGKIVSSLSTGPEIVARITRFVVAVPESLLISVVEEHRRGDSTEDELP
jgi:hypothetical protein